MNMLRLCVANDILTPRVFNSDVPHPFDMPMSRSLFSQTELHVFEDGEFPIPIGYDMYLKTVYGDYMTPPPKDKRENRHQIIQLKL